MKYTVLKKHRSKPHFRKRLSIQIKIGVIMIVLTTVILAGYGTYQYRSRKIREENRLRRFGQNVADQLALNLTDPLWNFDINQARRVVEAEMQDVNILAILVKDDAEQILTAKTRNEDWKIVGLSEEIAPEMPPIIAEIRRGEDAQLGTVEVYMTRSFVQKELQRALKDIGGIVIGLDIVLFVLLTLSIQLLLIRPLKRLLHFANAMSEGDFRQVIDIRQRDEIGELAESFRNMKETIGNVVKQVQTASTEVTTGSQQLRDSAAKMSQGGTQQAASTEEVSSSMEEMMANITQNADNAQQTEKIALKAAQDAQEGGDAVTKAVAAMKTIAQKITIVEEIANRTHILSMNASIEASKAQEYGKGFAVVATEVRNLAGQTQHAAKEINALANNTLDLAEQAGEMLRQLVPDIQHTAELVQEISAASQEQRSGAMQVNQATQQLDNVSQEYAATSEQAASTAEELAAQAEHLQKMTAFFKLPKEQAMTEEPRKDWKNLLEIINSVSDEKAREHLLITLGNVMAETDQSSGKTSSSQKDNGVSPQNTARDLNIDDDGYGLELPIPDDEEEEGKALDKDFERY